MIDQEKARESAPRVLPLVAVAALIGMWELLSWVGALPGTSIPAFSTVAREIGILLGELAFWTAVGNTLQGWVIGLTVAIVTAVPLGIIIGSSYLLHRSTRVIVEFLRPIPSVALIPLAVLVFGTGLQSKLFLIIFAAFWPLLVQTLYGVRDIDPIVDETARAYHLGRFERLYRIKLPSAVPFIVTGVRISSAIALILAITAELVIGSPGLGHEIELARTGDDIAAMYGLIVMTGILGWGLNSLMTRPENRLLSWHPSRRRSP